MNSLTNIKGVKIISPTNKWCVHSYYTLCPYAPDGSGRVLVSGVDLLTNKTNIMIISSAGQILTSFEVGEAQANFFHTGCWQTWSADCRYVYYQGGDMLSPMIGRFEIATGEKKFLIGDMEGAPPFSEPIISGFLGMLYAAGYANGKYEPDKAPFPFNNRNEHGLFRFSVERNEYELALSVNDILDLHPNKDKIKEAEKEYIKITGNKEGFTLMAYCVRWSPSGERCLFYFGNHCVDKRREEPKLCYVFTANKDLSDIKLALDLSFSNKGVHWGWHPDDMHLIGYANNKANDNQMCLCSVAYDGSDFKMISKHNSGGHPSICPSDYKLLVTDEPGRPGRVVFIDLENDKEVGFYSLPCMFGDNIPPGRNRYRVCLHPVFSQDGKKVIVNALPNENSVVCELDTIVRRKI